MNYAINATKNGWRAINSIDDLLEGETYSETQPMLEIKETPLDKIAALEATITQRRLREAALGIDGGWLAAKDAEIAALRAQL